MATAQHGVVARRQLRALGWTDGLIRGAIRGGWLHRMHKGVFAVGHRRLTSHGRCLAAVLAYGPDALLSHRSAAWLWGLLPTSSMPIDVLGPVRGHRRPGIRLHYSRTLTDDDRATVDSIPVTSVPRALLDLAAVAPARLDRALEQAERLELFDLLAVLSLLDRCGRHPGAGRLRRALAAYTPLPFTRSDLERRFLRLIEEAGLPAPSFNAWVAGYEVDMYWADQRLVVELDGFEHHRTRAAFEADRLRDEALTAAGFKVIRLTWRRLHDEPEAVVRRLQGLLCAD